MLSILIMENKQNSIENGLDYIEKIISKGPINGESKLEFNCKISYLKCGRKLWIESYINFRGDLKKASIFLGISPFETITSLNKFGLDEKSLESLLNMSSIEILFYTKN
jgi:hypothetical protein